MPDSVVLLVENQFVSFVYFAVFIFLENFAFRNPVFFADSKKAAKTKTTVTGIQSF